MVKRLKLGKASAPSVFTIKEGSYFRKDILRMKKRGKPLTGLKAAIGLLASGTPLPGNFKDHPLAREWAEYRECHIESDFLLIYKIEENALILERVGAHSDLFQ